MDADDASSADMRRPFSDPAADPLALDEETVERLLSGNLPPAEAPPGYAGVAALLAAAAAEPTPEELTGQSAALAELRAVTRARAAHEGRRAANRPGVAGSAWRPSSWWARWRRVGWPARPPAICRGRCGTWPGASWSPSEEQSRPPHARSAAGAAHATDRVRGPRPRWATLLDDG